MNDDNSVPLHSVESIIAAIRVLPENERLRLIDHMKVNHEWLLGHMMVRKEWRDLMEEAARSHIQALQTFGRDLVETANEAHRRGKCARTKAERTEARNRIIDEAIAGGIDENDADALFGYVRQQDATLLWKNRSAKQSIDPKNMMTAYRRAREPKNNCNRSE